MEQSILIIDDDPDDCELVAEGILHLGTKYRTDFITDASMSLKFLEERNEMNALPSIIILDLNMPEIGGMEILEQIRKCHPDIPVILYSTTCNDEIIRQAKGLGAVDCIKKGTRYSDNLKFAHLVLSMIQVKEKITEELKYTQ
jgi:CheY-like chemotaxis protein